MTKRPLQIIVALASGLIFGFGLSLSGMLDPARVQGFLDIFGRWDPSLAFVLGGAVVIAFAGVELARRMSRPALDNAFHLPPTERIDSKLFFGSAIFGVGWGMAGFCPGPALASLSLGLWPIWLFVVAMIAGMTIHDRTFRR